MAPVDKVTPDGGQQAPASARQVMVWDLPTRLFHWTLVLLVTANFVTVALGFGYMTYHEYGGVAILTLVLFRLVWGVVGGRESRFSAFVRNPYAVLAYSRTLVKGDRPRHLGHNPLGGWSVVLMLLSLLVQAVTGLFANDDIVTEGPLFDWVSKSTSDWLTRIHLFNKNILIVLIAAHVTAVFYYLFRQKENLITPMFSGAKTWPRAETPFLGNTWLAALIIAVLALAAYAFLY